MPAHLYQDRAIGSAGPRPKRWFVTDLGIFAEISIIGHYGKSGLAELQVFGQKRSMKSSENAMLTVADEPFPTSVELVLRRYGALVDTRGASALAVAAMAPATKAAITADLKCFLAWCDTRRPTEQPVGNA
jgi:hypothetical protein